MAYVISNDCVACGTCIDECPVEAISEGLCSCLSNRMYQPSLIGKSLKLGKYKERTFR